MEGFVHFGLSHDSMFFKRSTRSLGDLPQKHKLLCGKACSKDWQLVTAVVLVLLRKVKPLQTVCVLHERQNYGTKRFIQDSISLTAEIWATVKVWQESLAWLSKPMWSLYAPRLKFSVVTVPCWLELAHICVVIQQSFYIKIHLVVQNECAFWDEKWGSWQPAVTLTLWVDLLPELVVQGSVLYRSTCQTYYYGSAFF